MICVRRIFSLSKFGSFAIMALLPTPRREGGESRMSEIYALILDIMAGIIAHYVCKWFDGE
jgi:hypothetical protein